MDTAEGKAYARAALAGNPSDGYGGATLAVTIPGMVARTALHLEPTGAPLSPRLIPGGESELVRATVDRFRRATGLELGAVGFVWTTAIPRCVGLGGSSAIVIATLRALCAATGVGLEPAELAELALAIEVEDLGITAGLQDRVAQAFEGLTFMDFAGAEPRYERLDQALLPPLVVAYRADSAQESGGVHSELRARFDRGEPEVREAMAALGEAARSARASLIAGEPSAFCEAVDLTYDLRVRLAGELLDPRHTEMIEVARDAGAAANYTGSGGAIVAVCRDDSHRDRVRAALEAAGSETVGLAQYISA
jgi:glucuronokinase